MVLATGAGVPRMTKGILGRSVGVKVAVAGVRLIGVRVGKTLVGRGVDVIVASGVSVGVQVGGNTVLVMVIVGVMVSAIVGGMVWTWARGEFGGYGFSGIWGLA
jgi:hypothetical protein